MHVVVLLIIVAHTQFISDTPLTILYGVNKMVVAKKRQRTEDAALVHTRQTALQL